MTKLSRKELIEIAHVLILANTPLSLLKGLRLSSAMKKFRTECSAQELHDYYDSVTARPGQSELTVALSYVVFIAFLLEHGTVSPLRVDPGRLHWGEYIQSYLTKADAHSQYSEIPKPSVPSLHVTSNASSGILLGADGLPIRRGMEHL